mmetsp:Transcript_4937/g.9420  ORF Transcript_4937/g.9420 Transcript_4937/m.9420 type:complete len:473 (-) Transcript_4937:149-1567(-)
MTSLYDLSTTNNDNNKMNSNNNLSSWLKEHRVMSSALLEKLDELGANQVEDLVDLSFEDIESFNPLLKKLEFIRFKRAVSLLQQQNTTSHVRYDETASERRIKENNSFSDENTTLPPAVITIDTQTASGSSAATITGGKLSLSPPMDAVDMSKNKKGSKRTMDVMMVAKDKRLWLEQMHLQQKQKQKQQQQQQQPPLPSSCPEKNCHGSLSSHQGKRKIKALIKLQGPDYRWIVTCSDCNSRWHACHFMCGYLSKISRPTGSSDIIRHEMGRYNRWQNKITPPCKNNPLNQLLSDEYNKEQVQSRLGQKIVENAKNHVPSSSSTTATTSIAKTTTMPQSQLQLQEQQQQQQQQQHLYENDEQEMSMTHSFLNELDCPLAKGYQDDSCPFTQKHEPTSSSSASLSKRTKVNDQGEYTGSVMAVGVDANDEIDLTCDELKKLILGECHDEHYDNDDDCSLGADCLSNDNGPVML